VNPLVHVKSLASGADTGLALVCETVNAINGVGDDPMRSILALASLLLALPAHALVAFDWVAVGDPGNAADDTSFGAVAYAYEIARFETTNAQYAEFLNAVAATDTNGLYHASMGAIRRTAASRRAVPREASATR
jgi:hypothetical protein